MRTTWGPFFYPLPRIGYLILYFTLQCFIYGPGNVMLHTGFQTGVIGAHVYAQEAVGMPQGEASTQEAAYYVPACV